MIRPCTDSGRVQAKRPSVPCGEGLVKTSSVGTFPE